MHAQRGVCPAFQSCQLGPNSLANHSISISLQEIINRRAELDKTKRREKKERQRNSQPSLCRSQKLSSMPCHQGIRILGGLPTTRRIGPLRGVAISRCG